MPSVTRHLEIPILVALGFWGMVSAIKGATLSMFVSGSHQYRDEAFIELVYASVIVAAFLGLLSPLLAAMLSFIAGVISVMLVYKSNGFGHGSAYVPPLLLDILLRPALSAGVLFFLPPVGPLGRLLLSRIAKIRARSQ